MHEEIARYLNYSYRRDILGESVGVEMPAADPVLMQEVEAEIAQIDALRLGPHLANRDFVSYANRRALVRLLQQLKSQNASQDSQDAPAGQ